MKVRINDAGNLFFYTAREQEAELLLKAGLAEPQGRSKKIRSLRLTVGRGQAWAFLRGGRSVGQSSQTIRVERVGDKRLPVFQHQVERCLEFRAELKVTQRLDGPQASEPKSAITPAEPVETCEELPAVDNSCAQPEIEIAVHPDEKEVAEKGEEGVTTPADLETPRLCEARCNERAHPIILAETILEPDPSDISALRKLGAAVLVRAFEDARTDTRARQWFEVTPQPMLTFWCEVVGLDVGRVRKRAKEVGRAVSG